MADELLDLVNEKDEIIGEVWKSEAHGNPKIPRAIGKSYAGPALGKSAGARLTVILEIGKSAPEFFIALLTRSFDSSKALSGNPTIVKLGKLDPGTSTSTSTRVAFNPTVVPEETFANTYKD